MSPVAQSPSSAPAPAPTPASKAISIRSFKPEDVPVILELFTAGMMYYANKPELASMYKLFTNFVVEAANGDFAKIDEVYFQSGGHFWVATAQDETGNEVVVGYVGLEGKPDKAGELRRLCVRAEYRRYGVGRLLVANLEKWAQDNGFDKVWLSTGSPMVEAQKFYLSIDYTHTKKTVYTEEPYFELVYFEKVLPGARRSFAQCDL